ncbi:PGF-pre-PGF domain-containing protein [uncultured Methanolobus sp.]|uniref:PGF-pre-PGF domain-containing protein n=1 Tax=uncultured Methanolobus sp. TaxID=218300 RepID=UPI002AAC1EA9|nr:PGF-pre-PGF domain-containing protein [uncultured Methanolobus sp.]
MIKEETKRKKLILQLGLVLILVLLTVISASAAITPAGNGVVTIYENNVTEYPNDTTVIPTFLNFTATVDEDVYALNITSSEAVSLLIDGDTTYYLSGFENVTSNDVTTNGNVVTISNSSNIIIHSGTTFSINVSDDGVNYQQDGEGNFNLSSGTYPFYFNTSTTPENVPIYLTIEEGPSVIPVNYTQLSTTWVKNGTILTFNTSITDLASGVQNATVDITSINSSAGVIDLYNTFFHYWTNSSFIVSATDGRYDLPITSYDNVSYVNNSENFTVWVDNTGPTVTPITFGETKTWVSNGTSLPLNVSVSDSASGVYNVSVGGGMINNSLGPVSLSYVDGYWINDTIIVGTSTQGPNYMPITASDNLSNINGTVNFTVWVDNVEPNVTAISPVSTDSWVNNGSVLYLNVSASDPGNSNASNVSSVTVNVSSVNSSSTAILNNIGGTDYWFNNSLLVSSSSEGSIDLQIGVSDNASNVNNSVNLTLKVDNTIPAVSNESAAYPSGFGVVNNGSMVLLNLSATDSLSDLNLSAVMINVSNLNSSLTWETMTSAGGDNFTLSVIVDNSSTGTAVVPISVADNATNTNTTQSISVVLDNSGPLVTGITPNGSQWLTNGSTIDINVSSTDLGTAGVQNLEVNTSSVNATGTAILANAAGNYWTNSSLTVFTTNEGTIDLPVSAYDNLSNLNDTVNLTIKVDNSAPVFTTNESVYPGGMNAINNGGTVTLNVTVADAYSGVNASTVEVNVSGINSSLGWETLALASGDNFTLDVIVNTSSSGTVVLPVRAADNLSIWNTSASISVEIDSSEPTVTPVSPTGSMWFKSGDILDLNVSIIDTGTGVKNATVSLNNVNTTVTTAILEHAGGNYWINNSLTVDSVSDGTFNLSVVSYDNSSNVNNSVNLTINVDSTIPSITNELAAYPSGLNVVNSNGTVLLNFTATDATSGLNLSAVMINVSNLNSSLNWETMTSAGGDNFTLSVIVDNSSTGTAVVPISVADNASNTNTSQSISVVLDNSEPLVTGITPNGSQWLTNGSTIDINVSSTDLGTAGVQNLEVNISSVNATGTAILANAAGNYWTNSSLTVFTTNEGTIDLPVSAYDNLSNLNDTVNLTIKVDNSAPVFTTNESVYPGGMNAINNGGTVTLNVTVADAYSGVNASTVEVNVSGINSSLGWETLSLASGDNFTLDVIVNTSSSGTVVLPVRAADNLSIWNTSASISVEIDSSEPTVTPVSPTGSMWFKSGDVLDLNVSIIDTGTGVKNATVSLNNVNTTVTTAILEHAGGNYWINNSLTVDSVSDGTFNLSVVSYDNSSNVNNSVNLTINVDSTIPSITNELAAYPSGLNVVNSNGTVLLNFTATDATSGLNLSAVMINVSNLNSSLNWETMTSAGGDNFTLSVMVDNSSTGTAVVPISVADNASNTNTSQSISVVLDNSEPLVTGITPNGSQWVTNSSSIDLNVSSTDVGSAGMSSVTVDTSDVSAASTAVLNNSAGDYWTNSSLTVLTSNEGIVNLTVSSYDNLSNINSSVNLTIKVDNSAPVFTNAEAVYLAGMNGVRDGGIVTLNATVTDAYSGLNSSSVMVNASLINNSLGWTTMTSAGGDDFTLTVIVNTSSSGTLSLPVRAADNLSQWNTSASISVEVDGTEPAVTAISPTGSQWFKDGDTLDLNATIVDSGTGVKNATVTLNGVNDSTFAILEHAGSNYWINNSLIVDSSSEGTINLSVVAYDNVSNYNSSVNLSIKVDNTEPLVLDAQTEYATGYTAVNNGSTITLNATISDGSLSGVSSVMSIDNVSSISANDNVTLSQVSSTDYWKYSNLEIAGAEGTYLLNVTATDEAGNVNGSSSATIEVIIDNTDPVIYNLTLSTESPGSYGESINVSVNVSDAGSGIKGVTAAGTALTDQGSNIWNGTISAGYGANTVTVVATDNASNAVSNTSLSYTGPAAPRSSSSSSSSGMSSTTREAFLESKSTYEGAKIVSQDSSGKVLSDPVKVVSVALTRTEVTGVEVESEVDIEKISVSVQKLDSKPDNIPGSAPGEVHSYLNIEVSELDAGSIAGASITFKVEKSWLKENGISTDDVVLSHYTGSAWDQLDTTVSSDDGEYVYYVAKTPGFSTFAISTRSDSEDDYVASGDVTGSDSDAEDTESEPEDEMPDTEDDNGLPGFGILLGIMGVSIVAALMRQKNRNE